MTYDDWMSTLKIDRNVLGGTITFNNTRLAVEHIGGMLAKGVDPLEIMEDYPYLTANDLIFAMKYYNDRRPV